MDDQTPLSPDAIAETTTPEPAQQAPDTPGHDENGDGLKGGQATADNFGDVLGV